MSCSWRWLGVLAVFVVTVSWSERATATGVPAGFWGVVPVTAPSSKQVARISRVGVSNIRAPLNWSQVQPAPGTFDWSSFDPLMLASARHGVRVLPFLVSTPRWVGSSGAVLPVDTAAQQVAWVEFLRAAVHRYGRRGTFWAEHPSLRPQPVETWQVWNEPNLPEFAQPPDPGRYLTLVRLSTQAIRSVDPAARILLGGLFVSPLTAVPGAYPAVAFLADMYTAGGRGGFAGVSIHPYVPSAQFLASIFDSVQLVMQRYGASKTPLWVTEMGWSSLPPGQPFARGPRGQAQQLRSAFGLLARNRSRWRLTRVYWFSLTDSDSPEACSFCYGTGLFTAGFRPKPSWHSFAAFARMAGKPPRQRQQQRR